jgi:Fic family protein
MHSLSEHYIDRMVFGTPQLSTLAAIAESRGRQELFTHQTPQALATLRQAAVVESSESSNRLEGITAAKGRVRDLVLRDAEPQNRSEAEIAGYRDALHLVHESHPYLQLDTDTVLRLHQLVYRYIPGRAGRWKDVDNEIVERNPDGSIHRVRFVPTKAAETPDAMELWVQSFRRLEQLGREPFVLIPLTILDFLCIHPFLDGNGRISRLLTLLLLYRVGYRIGRYISLERIFEETKVSYYDTLEKSSQRWHTGAHDPYPWLDYFWSVLLRAGNEFEERVGTIRAGRGSKTDQIKLAVGRRLAPFAISDIEADCPGVSRELVRKVLRELRDEGAIELQGRGRSAKWLRRREIAQI